MRIRNKEPEYIEEISNDLKKQFKELNSIADPLEVIRTSLNMGVVELI